MHRAAFDYVARTVSGRELPAGDVLEIGSRDVNGSVRELFPGRRYIGSDIAPGDGVDIVASGADVELSEPAAVVVTTETLEHTLDAEAICRNAFRLLMPGGVFIVTCAGEGRAPHSAVDGGPLRAGEFYANVTELDLAAWLDDFAKIAIEENPEAGDIYAWAVKG
jgi:SAM-dependent methyltransferase